MSDPTGKIGTRYTLPLEMGGYECEIIGGLAKDGNRVQCEFEVVSLGVTALLTLPFRLLTPVKPPLPAEPPEGSLVACGIGLRRTNPLPIARRWADGWEFYAGGPDEHDGSWRAVVSFARAHSGSDPVLLVPDPFAEPVQLPWQVMTVHDDARVLVYPSDQGDGTVCFDVTAGGRCNMAELTVADAREFCRAVWAAANQADKGDHE